MPRRATALGIIGFFAWGKRCLTPGGNCRTISAKTLKHHSRASTLRVYSVARANEAVEAARALQAAASRQAASVVEAAQKAAQRAV